MHHLTRRHALLGLAALPAACAIQPPQPLERRAIAAPASAPPLRAPQVGQSWRYRQINGYNAQQVAIVTETVSEVGADGRVTVRRTTDDGQRLPDEVHASWGRLLRDPVWDYPLNLERAAPLWPPTLAAGSRSSVQTHYRQDGGSFRYWIAVDLVARGWERVALGGTAFETLHVERLIRLAHEDNTRLETVRSDRLWLAPEIGRWVARETSGHYLVGGGKLGGSRLNEDRWRWELVAAG